MLALVPTSTLYYFSTGLGTPHGKIAAYELSHGDYGLRRAIFQQTEYHLYSRAGVQIGNSFLISRSR